MVIFFAVFFILYAAVNFYIFRRASQSLKLYPGVRPLILIAGIIAALSYVTAKFFSLSLHPLLYEALLWAGSFWFAYILYLVLFLILIDTLRFILNKAGLLPPKESSGYLTLKAFSGIAVFIITTGIIFAGYLNSNRIVINEASIEIFKGKSQLDELRIALVADIHLSLLNDEKILEEIVRKINSVQPDIVLMPGDIVDDKPILLDQIGIGSSLKKIKSKYGIYISNGNHEFISGVEESAEYLTRHGAVVIRDTAIMIDSSFYVIGREDRVMPRFTGKDRKSLSEIMKYIETGYPVFLIDHTPSDLKDAEKFGIDLQLSGHTHHGQMFPANLVTSLIYEVSRGYSRRGSTQYYVTSGAGTWGPKVRLGSDSEIVVLNIKFVK